MAWKHDALFDARVRPPEPSQLLVRVANRTMRFWIRVLWAPVTTALVIVAYQNVSTLDVVVFACCSLHLYLLFIDPRVARYQIVVQRGLRDEPLRKACMRYRFIRETQSDPKLMSALDDTTGASPNPDLEWTPSAYLIFGPSFLMLIHILVGDVEHSELYSKSAILPIFIVLVVLLLMWKLCRRLGVPFKLENKNAEVRSGNVVIPLEKVTCARLCWDSLFAREYLLLRHSAAECRLYNHTDDPLYLLRLLKYRLPENAVSGSDP